MIRYNFIFARTPGGEISANLTVRANGFVRVSGAQKLPALVQVSDQIQTNPHPASLNTVAEILEEEMAD